MNRQIIFRGKRLDNGEWVYGDLEYNSAKNIVRIHTYDNNGEYLMQHLVQPDAVGQFSGMFDKNGKEIYEGDIILYGNTIKNVVVFRHGAFGYLVYGGEFISYAGNTNFTFNPLDRSEKHEVIGNIFDNPDLLKRQVR